MLPAPLSLRRCPNIDIDISPIGLGTVKFGRNQGVKYPKSFNLPSDKEALNILGLAQDLGINLLDTAPAYGQSEERLGQLIKRQDWVIVNKVGEEFVNGESYFDFSPEHIRLSVERSLRRLNTDYIDMMLLHSNGKDLSIIEQGALDCLAKLKQEGLIRATGMSTKTVEGALLAAEQCDAVMVTYNLQEQADKVVLDYCKHHKKTALIKKALASGHIAADDPQQGVQKSWQFVFEHPGTTAAIVGTINPEHLKSNVRAYHQARL